MNTRAAELIRPEILALSAYAVPSSDGFIKLDAMENPYTFPEALKPQLMAHLAAASLNRYPDAGASVLREAIREAMQIPAELDIVLGNGSDEIIQIIAAACAKPGATLLAFEPSFVMFKMIATFCGLRYAGVPLTADFAIDMEATRLAIKKQQPAVVFIAYPNNPTGNLFSRDAIHEIITNSPGLVVIDEAYFAFASRSFLDEIANFPNAVLMRTVSKLGLAGLRLGLLAGHPEWIREFDKVRLPYNINSLTQAGATFALKHYVALLAQATTLRIERTQMLALLRTYPGVTVFASEANFILLRVPDSKKTFDALLSRKILVKHTGTSHPLLANTLRVTIGTPTENAAFLAALRDII
ncbi:MAG: histidinol-phosphate transaminase [Burkholderiales bacterium]|nr:histidinol-phosphate transaminase [Burkholderiales bacterium]